MTSGYTELTYSLDGYVGVITLQRPEARNALTFTTYAELEDADRTTTALCLVITGADQAFCSGDDVKQVMRDAADHALAVQRMKQGLRQARDPDLPAIGVWVSQSLGELFQTHDHREGVAAFLERREPSYEGR